jgi:hypothetical protein
MRMRVGRVDRPRCYAGNRGVEEAIRSGSGSTLIVQLMQLKRRRRCVARAHSVCSKWLVGVLLLAGAPLEARSWQPCALGQSGRSGLGQSHRRGEAGSVTPGVTPPANLVWSYAYNPLISLVPAEGLEPPTH